MLNHNRRRFGALWGSPLGGTEEDPFGEAAGECDDVLRAGGEEYSVLRPDMQNWKIHNSKLQEERHNAGRKGA
jgi:hypothetical protein